MIYNRLITSRENENSRVPITIYFKGTDVMVSRAVNKNTNLNQLLEKIFPNAYEGEEKINNKYERIRVTSLCCLMK